MITSDDVNCKSSLPYVRPESECYAGIQNRLFLLTILLVDVVAIFELINAVTTPHILTSIRKATLE